MRLALFQSKALANEVKARACTQQQQQNCRMAARIMLSRSLIMVAQFTFQERTNALLDVETKNTESSVGVGQKRCQNRTLNGSTKFSVASCMFCFSSHAGWIPLTSSCRSAMCFAHVIPAKAAAA